MPGMDGTGPAGMGPMTGGGRGRCNPAGPAGAGYGAWGSPWAFGQMCYGYPAMMSAYGCPMPGYGMGMAWGRGRAPMGMGRGMAWGRGGGFGRGGWGMGRGFGRGMGRGFGMGYGRMW
jgi:hypothetical protein